MIVNAHQRIPTNKRTRICASVLFKTIYFFRFALLLPHQAFIQRQRLCMHLFGHGLAGLGRGGLLGLRRIGSGDGGLHGVKVRENLLLEFGIGGLDGSLVRVGSVAVGQQVRQRIQRAVIGIRPVFRIDDVALVRLIVRAFGWRFVALRHRPRRDLVAIRRVGRQQRIIRHERIVHVVVKAAPFDEGGVRLALGTDLEDMGFDPAPGVV